MVDIRPNQLPDAILPLRDTDELIVDQGTDGVRKAPPSEAVNSVAPVASQAEAVAGSDNVKRMTALRTKQSIASEVGITLASNVQGEKADSSVQSVNGKTGNSVTLVKGDVGLGNVDNTSDSNKPISTATQTALNLKADDSVVVKTINNTPPTDGNIEIYPGLVQYATISESEDSSVEDRAMSPYLTTNSFKYRGYVSPMDFGKPAAGGDITSLMLDVASAEDIFAVKIPSGVWSLEDEPVILNRPFSISGFGQEVSQLIQRQTGKSAIKFISTQPFSRYEGIEYRTIALKLEGISFISASNNPANAIHAEWVDRVDETCFFSAYDVTVMPDDFSHYFGKQIYLKNCNGTRMDNVKLLGQSSKRGLTGAKPYDANAGIHWDSGTEFMKVSHVLSRVTARDINTAFMANGSMEGFYFYGCDPALVGDAYDFSLGGPGVPNSPNFHVIGGHCNFRRSAFRLANMYNAFISSVDMLHDGEAGASIDSDYIWADNVPFLDVNNSTFGNRVSLHTGINRGVHGDNNMAYTSVKGNKFNGVNTEHVNIGGTTGQLYASENIHIGGTGFVGYRTGSNITGVIGDNNFINEFVYKVDATNKGMIVKNNTPSDNLLNFADGDTTPSVGGRNASMFSFNNSAATNIATFDDGYTGQVITCVAQNGNTTLINSGVMIVRGASGTSAGNRTLSPAEVVRFINDGSGWREIW